MNRLSRLHGFAALVLSSGCLFLFANIASAQSVTIISPSKQSPVQTNLVSDIPGLAVTTDPNLVNPWGIANSAASPYWISDQGTGKATLYNGAGTPTALVVAVPPIGIPSGPTGIVSVAAGVTGFDVPGGTTTAHFIFATLDGTIAAWASGASAITAATQSGAVFTGLTMANNGSANYLYAADFVSGGTIQIFDSTFASTTLPGSFTDPTLTAGYAPYNIQLLNGKLYVAYAQVGVRGAATGAGLGFVSVFDTNGNFLQRLVSNGALDAPWGMTLAPSGFMTFANDLLVGNFGDGEINAFDPTTGNFLGTISDSEGKPLVNSGLWAIEFGNGNAGSSPTSLYFNAGINGEQDGLFGAISPGPLTLTFAGQLIGTASAAQSITVENTGSANLVLSAAPALGSTTEFAIATTGTTCTNGAVIPAGGSCVVSMTFTPSAAGARGPVSLSISDNVSGSPQTVVLSGTGTVGSPNVTVSPATSLTFAGQLVTTTSAAQNITVTNNGTAPLTFGASAITVSNDFAQTNTCNGTSVAVNGSCTVSVAFAPSSTANNPRAGTVSMADNATGSPQIVSLSGTAWDFGVSAQSTASTTAGTAATIPVTISALGGFTGSVALACSASIPHGSCAVSPSSVSGSGAATLTITTSSLVGPWTAPHDPLLSPIRLVSVLLMLGLALALVTTRRAKTRFSLVAAILLVTIVAGCGGSGMRTTAGTYSVTVTGTSGSSTRSAAVSLTVN